MVVLVATFFAITTGNYFGKKLSIEIGQIAPRDIFAPFQVENEIGTERKRIVAEQSVKEVYKVDASVGEKALQNVNLLFDYVRAIKDPALGEHLQVNALLLLQEKAPIALYEDEYRTLLLSNSAELTSLQNASILLLETFFEQGIKEDENKSLEIRNALENMELTPAYQKIVYEIVSSQIKTNIVVDEEATKIAKQEARDQVEPMYVLQEEKIIGQGSRVTEETYLLLDKIGYLDKEDSNNYTQYLGIVLFLGIGLVFVSGQVKKNWQWVKDNPRQYDLMLLLYVVAIGIIRLTMSVDASYMPLALIPMLVAILIRKDVAVLLHVLLVSLSAIVHKGDILFILYLLITGLVAIFVIEGVKERKQTMKSAAIVGATQAIIYIGLKLIVGVSLSTSLLFQGAGAFVVGLLSVILVVGSLPLWEVVFGIITPIQLLELTNPNQPVLKRLLIEATGTYYHSLLVANLAETAASEVGASPLMARVGGYYHDIGKLASTNYFKENQVVENPHDYLEPAVSAKIILSHTQNGLEMAKEYKLPQCIKDIIMQHHGTSFAKYFYIKAKELQEDVDVKEEEFRYPGPKPQTKEAGLIMLADVVEATVRSMQHKIGKDCTVESIVRKMVKQKLEDGELDECPLYISDIEKVIGSFTKMLKGMYHERIEYPDGKGKKE
jgi:hypothetical protein